MNAVRCILALLCALLVSCSAREQDQRIVLGFSQIGAESEWRTANTESIKSAATTSNLPNGGGRGIQLTIEGRTKPDERLPIVTLLSVGPKYFDRSPLTLTTLSACRQRLSWAKA